ncbi:MAG TPA: bifunctional diaminohydroxyphosphoribosylaminopyrimidine deaminase/5-amino-6-(5-phosphoribosylamino)uracil reductase RibD [candidate division Zixibacteria bacterium]|nr:bifunctional diaminohydroxyphosphoribosylaminopyrimidine deaminase/5-amino-6-(5-phosphoribosylamino)uracil reductase RibD [candidate division Zixibacteria bacterium]HBZ01740.1 bifunctional diaminohydroxyphosphoribosylaminopyrimidine deaminase/5-amino-6-(5-phosphoribosylamino)uracil reductase RibD [candidate division Zixibacteria bacterium]
MGEFDKIMAKAFRLAEKGLGYTSPNPAVGAILFRDGEIIAKGYHRKAGLPHAEIEALNVAGERARGATLFTTLEPCSHFGKTPPCVDAVIAAGVSKVVSAAFDPNPLVRGRGFSRLKDAGIEVIFDVLKEEAVDFYRPYTKFITTGFPFVTLKYAQSLDGRLATKTGNSQWISSKQSLLYSHKLRAINDAIIIGRQTLISDNPQLTTRLVKGPNPIRIVVSASGKLPFNRAIFTDGLSSTYVATLSRAIRNSADHFQVISVRGGRKGLILKDLLSKLAKMGVMTALVEGGSRMLTSFLSQKAADKIVVCTAPILIGDGISAIGDLGIKKLTDSLKLVDVRIRPSGPDIIVSGYLDWK